MIHFINKEKKNFCQKKIFDWEKAKCINMTVLIQAPCEAEASCAALVRAGKVYATATEDMDGLTFGTGVLLRHLTASEAKYVSFKDQLIDAKKIKCNS